MLPELIYAKKDLASIIARECGMTKKKALEIVETVFASMKDEMAKGNEVSIHGFGKFEVKTRAARKGVNPATKEVIDIAESKVVSFKAAKALKDLVKQPL